MRAGRDSTVMIIICPIQFLYNIIIFLLNFFIGKHARRLKTYKSEFLKKRKYSGVVIGEGVCGLDF